MIETSQITLSKDLLKHYLDSSLMVSYHNYMKIVELLNTVNNIGFRQQKSGVSIMKYKTQKMMSKIYALTVDFIRLLFSNEKDLQPEYIPVKKR